jgi:hypothetical protein
MLHCNEFHSPLSGISPKCISIAPSTFALQRHLFLDKAGISWLSIYALQGWAMGVIGTNKLILQCLLTGFEELNNLT